MKTHPLVGWQRVLRIVIFPLSGTFRTQDGSTRHYVATDYLASPRLSALGDGALFALSDRPGLEPDGYGVVFHMLSGLTELGRMGMTVIGSTAADAQERFETVHHILLNAAANLKSEVAVVT